MKDALQSMSNNKSSKKGEFNKDEFEESLKKVVTLRDKGNLTEEDEFRLKTSMKAINLTMKRIKDPNNKSQAYELYQRIINSKAVNEKTEEKDSSKKNDSKIKQERIIDEDEETKRIKEHLYKDTKSLRKMTEKFSDDIDKDIKVVKDLQVKISENIIENKKASKEMTVENNFSSSTILFYSVLLFIISYFILRFI